MNTSSTTTDSSYPLFDCDNHCYEPQEALFRHLPSRFEHVFKYVQIDGRTKLLLDGRTSEFIPNPSFDAVAVPGCHVDEGTNATLRE